MWTKAADRPPRAWRSCARRIPAFWWAALAVALVRGLVAWSRLDELELELYSGSLAWSLVKGMPLDLHQLPVIPHNRGSVVFGVVLAPAFWMFGPRLGVIKVLAVLVSAATAGLLAGTMERHVSRRAGLAAAALLAFLPPNYQMVDVLALASHGDSILFTALALAILLGARKGRDEPGPTVVGPGRAVALGLVLGLSGFFSLQCLVAVPALLAVWWLLDRGFWRRPATFVALGLAALWILPARAMLGAGDGAVIVNQSATERFLPGGALGALTKWGRTFGVQLRESWVFDLHGGDVLGWVMLAALAVGLALVLPRVLRLEPLAVFCVLYPALVSAAYAASNFRLKLDDNLDGMGSRYLMPMQAFMALWIAFGMERTEAGRPTWGRWPARVAWVGAVGAGLVGWVALLDLDLPLRQPTVRGTELAFFHGHVERAGGDDPADRLAWIERVEPDWPAWRPLIHQAVRLPGDEAASSAPLSARVERIRAQPERVRPYLWAGLGRERAAGAPAAALAELAPLAEDELRWVLRGAGSGAMMRAIAETFRRARFEDPGRGTFDDLSALTAGLAPAQRDALVEGLGFTLGLRLTRYQPTLLRALDDSRDVPDELAAVFYRAMGDGYRMRFLESAYGGPVELSIEPLLPERARAPFREGLLAGDRP
jgi:hypothetical protein